MHFYTYQNIRGRIIFSGDKFNILKIEGSDLVDNMNSLKSFPVCNNFRLEYATAPRYPSTLFLSKIESRFHVDGDDIETIENEVINTGDRELSEILLTLKAMKGKTEKFEVEKTFMTAFVSSASIIHWALKDIVPEEATFHYQVTGEQFVISTTQASRPAVGIFFLNEFESVYISFEDESIFRRMWAKVTERASLDGRISGEYLAIPTSEKHRTKVTVHNIKNMKTEDMLEFFSCAKKAGTKVDTLASCLENLTRRNVKNLEVGDIGLMQITTHGVPETPMDIPPVDWVMSRMAHMTVKYAEPVNDNTTNMFVEIVERPVLDVSQALFAMFEQSKQPIQVAYFSPNNIERLFLKVKEENVTNNSEPVTTPTT